MDEKRLEERKAGLGGSDSPVVAGVSPFKTARELWLEKRGELSGPSETPAMRRGTVLEPVVAKLYASETGRKLRRVNEMRQHPEKPFLLANLDRMIVGDGNPGVLEIKCPGLRVFAECKRNGLPDYYLLQLQHYLGVTGWKWGGFAVFNAEQWQMLHFDVQRDDELIALIFRKDEEFWSQVIEGVPPEDIEAPALDLPKVGGELIKIDSPELDAAVEQLREARAIIEEAEALKSEAESRVKEIMEKHQAQVIEGAGARIYWKPQESNRFDTKRFRSMHPDLYGDFVKPSQSRPFRPYFLTNREVE